MKYIVKSIIVLLAIVTVNFAVIAEELVTPGMSALRRHDYENATKLLTKERSNFAINSAEYQNYSLLISESLLYDNQLSLAQNELNAINQKLLLEQNKNKFDILQAGIKAWEKNYTIAKKYLYEILDRQNLTDTERNLTVNFLVAILVQEGNYKEALECINKLNLNSIENLELKNNLWIERIKLLIMSERFDEAQKDIVNLKASLGNTNADIVIGLDLLLLAYQNDFSNYKIKRQNYNGKNSIVNLADQKMLKNFTGKAIDTPDYYFVLQAAEASMPKLPNDEHMASLKALINYELQKALYSSALKNIDTLLALYPQSPDRAMMFAKKAEIYKSLKDNKSALQVYDAIMNDNAIDSQNRIVAAEFAAELYLLANDHEHALAAYDFIIKHSKSLEEIARINMLIGLYYFRQNNFFLALNYFQKINKGSSYFKDVLFLIIQCNLELKNYAELENNLKEMEKLISATTPVNVIDSKTLRYFVAELYENTGKLNEALKIYEALATEKDDNFIYADEAALKAAEINFRNHSYSNAALMFLNFAEKYPQNVNADKALYKAMYSYHLANQFEETQYAVSKLQEKYPKSKYTTKSLFHIVDYYRNLNQFDEALKVLTNIESLIPLEDQDALAQLIYDRALIYNESQRLSKALDELDKLIKAYPDSSRTSDGLFLAGSISSDIGENLQAINYFMEALKISKNQDFIKVCQGRIADNYFLLYSKRSDREYLNNAIKIYSDLANDNKNGLFLRTQSFYKLGRSYELLEDYQRSLDAYNEAIYIGLSSLDNQEKIPLIWVNKSGGNAIKINLYRGGKNSERDALKILEKLKELNPKNSDEILELERNIKKKYTRN